MSELSTIPDIIENEVELLPGYTRSDVVDFRAQIDPGNKLTWAQIKLFLDQCFNMNLDPRRKHIHAIPRWNKNTGRTELTTVISIDGFRLVAERTGRYSPGKPTIFLQDDKGNLIGATVFVKKMTNDGTWHEVSETAFLHEYKPNNPNSFWDKMPSVMISKVAEARALRRAFPDTFSGIYGEDEMNQAEEKKPEKSQVEKKKNIDPLISKMEIKTLDILINGYDDIREQVFSKCDGCFSNLTVEQYPKVIQWIYDMLLDKKNSEKA